MNASEIVELLDKTYTQDNKFKFVADTHVYTYGTDIYTSVTTFLQRFHKPFKMDYWAEVKAIERGITKDEILNEWGMEFSSLISGLMVCLAFYQDTSVPIEKYYPLMAFVFCFSDLFLSCGLGRNKANGFRKIKRRPCGSPREFCGHCNRH